MDLQLSKKRIAELYAVLETLSVPLEKSPQRGLTYIKDKIIECRQKQDRVTDLLVEVRKLHPAVRTAVRNLKASISVAETGERARIPGLVVELNEAQDQDDEIRYLVEVIKAKQSNLRMTSSDIRLLYSVVEQQLKLGEIQPGRQSNTSVEPDKPVQTPPSDAPKEPVVERKENVPQADSPLPVQTDSSRSQDVLDIEQFLGE